MSHIHVGAMLAEPLGNVYAVLEICWRLPWRVAYAIIGKVTSSQVQPEQTSVWLAMATSIFAPFLAYNWHMLLARPTTIDPAAALLFPPDVNDKNPNKDETHGFHGFLYASELSPAYGKPTLKGADAVWIHAHGGGFYAGEARQYHHTYLRWTNRAYQELGYDLRILAVEYRKCDLIYGKTSRVGLQTVQHYLR